jgi:uncharacterized protein YdiU (UPF0061 family)
MSIPFDNTYARLPERFFARQNPARVPNPELIRLNETLAAERGLDAEWLRSPDGLGMLSGNCPPSGSEPIAQAYAGHQFGGWVPQLGDGRAILLGEIVDAHGVRRDIQLKGAGRTPFSRGGDGKAALGPVLREYLVSEAMHALGVPATRALAAVSTGETVARERGLPGGVFTRVAASHIRVGTFQYFAARNDLDALRMLTNHAIARHYPDAINASNPSLAFLKSVIAAQARLIAKWLQLGFIHGVMNTDNMAVSGETIDFGPCAFMDAFHPQCVFSSIDHHGRYAWGNQPSIGDWNLTRLAETLLPILADSQDDARTLAEAALDEFGHIFQSHHRSGFRAKLGIPDSVADTAATAFIDETLTMMARAEIDFTLFFRHLTRLALGADAGRFEALFTDRNVCARWLEQWRAIAAPAAVDAMRASNPVIIPRNHRVEEAIRHAYGGDFAPFHRLADALARPFEECPLSAEYERAPEPHEVVHQTFCGT